MRQKAEKDAKTKKLEAERMRQRDAQQKKDEMSEMDNGGVEDQHCGGSQERVSTSEFSSAKNSSIALPTPPILALSENTNHFLCFFAMLYFFY